MTNRSVIIRTALDALRDNHGAIVLSALAARLSITPAAVCGYSVNEKTNALMELVRPHGMTVAQATALLNMGGWQPPAPCECVECLVFRAGLYHFTAEMGRPLPRHYDLIRALLVPDTVHEVSIAIVTPERGTETVLFSKIAGADGRVELAPQEIIPMWEFDPDSPRGRSPRRQIIIRTVRGTASAKITVEAVALNGHLCGANWSLGMYK